MTKRENFEALLTILDGEMARGENVSELVDFVVGEITLIDKRRNAPRKPTTAQRENELTKGLILDVLDTEGVPMRATNVANAIGISVQKCSALMQQLVADNRVERIEDKKVITFRMKE